MGQNPATNFQASHDNCNLHVSKYFFTDSHTREVFKTGSTLNTNDGLVASGRAAGNKCTITIDTWSNISIVRPDILQGTNVPIYLVKSSLRTVTGATAPIQGRGEFPLEVDSFHVHQEMWVADITDECILGLDFLQQYDCQVDLGDGVLYISNKQIPLHKTSSQNYTKINATGYEPKDLLHSHHIQNL